MRKYKLSSDLPSWLKNLPPGEYTISEIQKKTNVLKSTIYMYLENLKVDRIKKISLTASNKKEVHHYKWKGAKFYYLRDTFEKVEKIQKILQGM